MADAEQASAERLKLLHAAAAGDERAWAELVQSYTKRVFALVYRQCGDRELAEEITQVTFVKLVEKLRDFAGYEERGKFEAWLFRVAMNKLRDEMRRRKRQAVPMDMGPAAGHGSEQASGWAAAQLRVVSGGPAAGDNPFDLASRREQVELLQAAVEQLGEADRDVIHLRHTAGLSFAQIAETLGEPLGTVLARGHRALKKLAKIMAQASDERMMEQQG